MITAPSKKRAPVNVIGPIKGATMDCGTNAQPHAQAAMSKIKLAWVRVKGLDIKKNSTNRFKKHVDYFIRQDLGDGSGALQR